MFAPMAYVGVQHSTNALCSFNIYNKLYDVIYVGNSETYNATYKLYKSHHSM